MDAHLSVEWTRLESIKAQRLVKLTCKQAKLQSECDEADATVHGCIKKAYKALSRIHHPDKSRSSDRSRWDAIERAYKLLNEHSNRASSYRSAQPLKYRWLHSTGLLVPSMLPRLARLALCHTQSHLLFLCATLCHLLLARLSLCHT